MQVRMKVDIAGTRNGEDWPRRGGTIELPDLEGAEMCAAGLAEPVVEDRAEKATAPRAQKRTASKKA